MHNIINKNLDWLALLYKLLSQNQKQFQLYFNIISTFPNHHVSQEFLTNQYGLQTIWVLLFLVTISVVFWLTEPR